MYGCSEFRYVRHAVSFLFLIFSLRLELLRYFEKYHIEKLLCLLIFGFETFPNNLTSACKYADAY